MEIAVTLALYAFQPFFPLLPDKSIELIRLIPGVNHQTLTLFLHDSFHESYFNDGWAARYGFLAVADRYQNFGCNFYLASYYHFAYLIGEDYKAAREVMRKKLDRTIDHAD